MSKIEFDLNENGVRELLQSPEMQSILSQYAAETANRAGEGYKYEVKVGQKRSYANISADTPKAYYTNLKHNTLLKALK